jgi:hypothetical protein
MAQISGIAERKRAMIKLVEIPQHAEFMLVPALLRGGAKEALRRADDLDLGAVRIRWWREVQPDSVQADLKTVAEPVTGWINTAVTDEINLNLSRLDGWASALNVALHELRHLYQARHPSRWIAENEAEFDAAAYVHKHTSPAPAAIRYGITRSL